MLRPHAVSKLGSALLQAEEESLNRRTGLHVAPHCQFRSLQNGPTPGPRLRENIGRAVCRQEQSQIAAVAHSTRELIFFLLWVRCSCSTRVARALSSYCRRACAWTLPMNLREAHPDCAPKYAREEGFKYA